MELVCKEKVENIIQMKYNSIARKSILKRNAKTQTCSMKKDDINN